MHTTCGIASCNAALVRPAKRVADVELLVIEAGLSEPNAPVLTEFTGLPSATLHTVIRDTELFCTCIHSGRLQPASAPVTVSVMSHAVLRFEGTGQLLPVLWSWAKLMVPLI